MHIFEFWVHPQWGVEQSVFIMFDVANNPRD